MPQPLVSHQVAEAILRAVADVQHGTGFGSVEIVLHEGHVTLIEKREKQRFTQNNKYRNDGADTLNNVSITNKGATLKASLSNT